ncbi:MAG: OB-fold domain-containing protein [Rhodospirillaceae bacterium]|nr:MAG: OB-fold domain-containing protein [Rhodospirillaceae bacterium]
MPDPIAPIAAGLFAFDADGQPLLLGGRDRVTGHITFPAPADEERFEIVPLPRTGRLWSWTVQRFRPKSPPYAGAETFEPFAVGYVQLGDTIIVEGRLVGIPFETLRIDLPMRVVTESFVLATGENRMTYAFARASDR